jgi:hypothetical protein
MYAMDNNFEVVRDTLHLARWLASHHRRGGLAGLHRQLIEALEALDRIEGKQAEQLPLVLWPQDLNRQAFALEEQVTAWKRLGWQPS